MPDALPGYHLRVIERGIAGESSKIHEEIHELHDAELQGVRIMALVELSDIIGAVSLYLEHHFPDFSLSDLEAMAAVTARAFRNGHRS
jgi:hypothetical protein